MRTRGQVPGSVWALSSGILSSLAFPPVGLAPLVFVAPLPLLWALEQGRTVTLRRSFLLGWIAAAAHFVIVLHWILWLPNEELTIPGLMIPALLFMAGYLAVFFGIAAALAVWIRRRLLLPLGVVWAVVVTLADLARSIGVLGFPWGSAAYALEAMTPVLQFTATTGFWGLAFWVALCGGLAYETLTHRGAGRFATAVLTALLLIGPWLHGTFVLHRAPTDRVGGVEGLRLVLIQPNTSREIKWDPAFREIVVEDLLDRTRRAGEHSPDLIIWPETAAPILLLQEPRYLARGEETVASLGIPLLAGTLDHRLEDGRAVSHNSAALFGREGKVVERYDKQHLVPFSERMPYQETVPWINALNFGQSDFTPGSGPVLFAVGGTRLGCLICFESIFPDLARTFAGAGARILVNITNDFWFGDTAAPVQHAEMAIFRAVETRLPLVRCANTGVSMVVDPWGRVSNRTATFVEAMIDVRVVPSSGETFYVRHGEWVARALLALSGALIAAAVLRSWRRRG